MLYSLVSAIIVGLLRTTSDYFVKPILSIIFNGLLQPVFLFAQNIFQSIRNMVGPLAEIMVDAVKPFTECLRAFRFVEVKNINKENRGQQARQTVQGQVDV